MTDEELIAAAFPEDWRNIHDLRARDQGFEEACCDFLEISRIIERLSPNRPRDRPTLEYARVSLSELKLELAERMKRAGYRSPKKTTGGNTL